MTTADRTAIRRRLSVRRAANRPPRRGRKAGHGSIFTPLGTVAAIVGVGVAAAIARAELQRRSGKATREERGPTPNDRGSAADGTRGPHGGPAAPPRGAHAEPANGAHPEPRADLVQPAQLQRVLLEQLDAAIGLLGEEPDEQTIHEIRKSLKRGRALLRLLRDAVGAKRVARENAALRDAARRLAGARDAEVLLDTLDGLLARQPELFARSRGAEELRARLHTERERAHAEALHDVATRAAVLGELRASRARIATWTLRESDRKAIRASLRRIYRQGRRRRRRARRWRDAAATHEWRKRVKDLRYSAEALGARRVARRADRIGEALGAEHDLALLAAYLRAHPECFAGERATRKALRKAIVRRRRQLHTRAHKHGQRLYRRKPRRFARRVLRP